MPRTSNAPKRVVEGLAVLAVATAALVPTSASAQAPSDGTTFSIELSSVDPGTRKKPKTVGLVYTMRQSAAAGVSSLPLRSVRVVFPPEVRLTPHIFALCEERNSNCSSSLRGDGPIAVGKAALALGDSEALFDTGVVYEGYNSSYIWARHAEDAAMPATTYRFPITFGLSGGRWRFSYELRPPYADLERADGLDGEFTSFTLGFPKRTTTVKRRGGQLPARQTLGLVALAGCPRGGLKFKAVLSYGPDSTAIIRITVPCSKA